jgi:hypothetical protein
LKISIAATHVPGSVNVVADSLSRANPTASEWELPQTEFDSLTSRLGLPQIDLFATLRNNKLPIFVSPFAHPEAEATNAFTLDWNTWTFVYIFPPPTYYTRLQNAFSNSEDKPSSSYQNEPQLPGS